ncbi:UDP-glucose 4-epimerase [hydrothermal vent metagenome]|uniref:UDP-glucose 4-epimerase n=1 Tax=hydrothermal vent metagenome TaxID=652676 RepID=A0A3B0WQH1_9ZZZZ
MLYASTAAVYGDNADFPVTEQSNSDRPLSLYAATKKANEVMAHSYASMYALPVTGLRFFTVYGPWGRPDMALYKFTDSIMGGLCLNIHNNGNHTRDLIYIDDLVDAILAALEKPPSADQQIPHKIYNIGNQKAIGLLEMIENLEQQLGRKTAHKLLPRQVGEIKDNQADTTLFFQQFGFKPQVDFKQGLKKFVEWYRQYHSV